MSNLQQIDKKALYKKQASTGDIVYQSYNTNIAVLCDNVLFITSKKYSVTTSKHCSHVIKLCGYPTVKYADQFVIDALAM